MVLFPPAINLLYIIYYILSIVYYYLKFILGVLVFDYFIMRIPFTNRTADVDLPAAPGQPKVTVRAIIDSFREQLPSNFSDLFEAFVLLSPRKVRVTCRTPHNVEEVQNLGLALRSARVTFHPCRTARWVNVTCLSYGVPNEALQTALSSFGKILNVKMASYQGVYVGVRNVLIEISTPIPSSLKITEH